jgi:uncharacterized membrane protein
MTRLLTFATVHITIAFTLGYLLTGSLVIAGAITFVEPLANTAALWALDKAWEKRQARRQENLSLLRAG